MSTRSGDLNLYVTDIPRASRFYREAFGLTVKARDPEGTWETVSNGTLTFTLFRCPSGRAVPSGSAPGMTADILVSDLDTVAARLNSLGATVSPIRVFQGVRAMNCADPDGISWEVIESD